MMPKKKKKKATAGDQAKWLERSDDTKPPESTREMKDRKGY